MRTSRARSRFRPTRRCRPTSGWLIGCWSWCSTGCRRGATSRCCRRWPTRWASASRRVSRETIEAGTRVLQELAERDLSELDVLVVYLDGIVFGDYHVLAAVGVDATGRKHVLGLREGPSENATVTTGLLEALVERGLQCGPAPAVRDRRRQGTAQRHRPRVRPGAPGPAL